MADNTFDVYLQGEPATLIAELHPDAEGRGSLGGLRADVHQRLAIVRIPLSRTEDEVWEVLAVAEQRTAALGWKVGMDVHGSRSAKELLQAFKDFRRQFDSRHAVVRATERGPVRWAGKAVASVAVVAAILMVSGLSWNVFTSTFTCDDSNSTPDLCEHRCDEGSGHACSVAARWYQQGRVEYPSWFKPMTVLPDKDHAASLLRKACDNGSTEACVGTPH